MDTRTDGQTNRLIPVYPQKFVLRRYEYYPCNICVKSKDLTVRLFNDMDGNIKKVATLVFCQPQYLLNLSPCRHIYIQNDLFSPSSC